MGDLTKCIPCSECKFAIYQPHDIFTGKPRYFCGNDILEIDEYGDQTLLCDIVGGECEFGIRKSAETAISADNGSNQTINNYGYLNCNTEDNDNET